MALTLLGPSSRNIRPWTFVEVDDPELLARLARAKPHGGAFLNGAPLAIVVLADPAQSDVWVEDTAIASTVLLLLVEDLGLGACWCQIRRRDRRDGSPAEAFVKEVIGAPDGMVVEAIIAIGYPESPRPPYDERELHYEKLRRNGFAEPYPIDE